MGASLGLLGGPAGPGGSLADAVRQLRDALAGVRGPGGRFGDTREVLQPVARAADDLAQVPADAFEQLRGAVERPAGVLGGLADIAGLAAALLRELVYLVGHDREAATVHPGARRLDGSIERQQVRLIRDEADGLGELLHLLSHVAQATHFARALLGGHAEVAEAAHRRLGGEPDLL